jgi:hypothetical protein
MPVRSIKVKLIVPRSEEKRPLRQALWTTHRLFNEGVRYYMKWLLRMKGEPRPEADLNDPSGELLRQCRKVIPRNGSSADASDEQLLKLFSQFYRLFLDGEAQSRATGFLRPLTSPKSKGGQLIIEKAQKPEWVKTREAGLTYQQECLKWARQENLSKDTGRTSTWKKRMKAWLESVSEDTEDFEGEPDWIKNYVEKLKGDQVRLEKGLEGLALDLRSYGVLPGLFDLFTKLPRFDTALLKYAVSQLQTWQSWSQLVREKRDKLKNHLERFAKDHGWDYDSEPHQRLRDYEEKRKDDLDNVSFRSTGVYRLGPRAIRGWERLHEKWVKAARKSGGAETVLWKLAAEEQAKHPGEFGDPHFFRWLAKSENHVVWLDGKIDHLSVHVHHNEIQRHLEEAKEEAALTLPDCVLHPKWAEWEAEGGSNLLTYKLRSVNGEWNISIPLFPSDGNEIRTFDFRIAPSGQTRSIHLNGHSSISFEDLETGECFNGKLGAIHLQFDREELERKQIDNEIGSVYVNITVSLDQPSVLAKLPQAKAFKQRSRKPSDVGSPPVLDYKDEVLSEIKLGAIGYGIDSLRTGLRVLSVDLGLRSLAACSVFELSDVNPDKKFAFKLENSPLFAVHSRSFVLSLPGENVDGKQLEMREQLGQKRLDLRAAVQRVKALCSLAGRAGSERAEELDKLVRQELMMDELRKNRVDAILDPKLLDPLRQKCDVSDSEWENEVLLIHRQWEKALGEAISGWRKEGRMRPSDVKVKDEKLRGLSFWSIKELMETRRLLSAWSAHARSPKEVVRARNQRGARKDDKAREVDLDKRLLEHINRLKEDRLKKGADAILMAALGYVYDSKNGWEPKYPACHLILFEDLNRYRFRTDRPRRENSQLMQWGHREILRTVVMQGDLYGVRIGEVGAGFTSRFHASSEAPGVRGRVLSDEDLKKDWILGKLTELGLIPAEIEPGDVVPWDGGELFITLDVNHYPIILHADINAAQNLQRRFWRRYEHPLRLSCEAVNSDVYYLPKSIGKRVERAIGFGKLVPLDKKGFFKWEELNEKQYRKLSSGTIDDDQDFETIDPELHVAAEELAERTGKIVTFFNDPSGIFFPNKMWVSGEIFWTNVRSKVIESLRKHGKLGQKNGALTSSRT